MPARVGATPIGDAVSADPARESVILAGALLDAITGLGLPVTRSAGAVSIIVRAASLHEGRSVRMDVEATRDGVPIGAWDRDRIITNACRDVVSGDTITEDIVGAVLSDLLEDAAATP
ncbi:MAG: hypothetical protein U1E23_14760 [Reyranellaceae bacterium]